MEIKLKYGKGYKIINLPDGAQVDYLSPASKSKLVDLEGSFLDVLQSPIGTVDLGQWPEPRSLAIALPDETRPFPTKRILPVLLKFLTEKWPSLEIKEISILVGGGLHPPLSKERLIKLVGPEIYENFTVFSHDAKKSNFVSLGKTSQGTPVEINQHFAQADIKIVLGQIDPHQFVGFTGGAKGACIGLASAEMIRKNHSLMFEDGANVGRLKENPVRQDLNEAGDILSIDLAVNVVNNTEKCPVWIQAGAHKEVLEAGAEICSKVYGVEISNFYDIVVASCGGSPKDICLYQAQKGLNMSSTAAKINGKILLLASCDEGVGDDDYYEYVSNFKNIDDVVNDFQENDFRMGAHKAYLFGRSLKDFEVVVDSSIESSCAINCHLNLGKAQTVISNWLKKSNKNTTIAVIPNANTTFFYRKNE
ncbi:nickel-dependent lactate racemase [Desulfohalobium retbaense]|uniref:Uncharacterized protein n=1 Tax=Desulfohalobium retbaense (strain ATCC 49708 / DSM 5692 / JCM 16813 / HR100) TaxID=485915 RepID=C8X5B3_DESRD|nr:nickel-dependent lactate racemase [Desulfohalobium retbaense]ACV69610.1 Protein of unknown function DUF2088 [Desulfohalobium retbaense DSM 5692]